MFMVPLRKTMNSAQNANGTAIPSTTTALILGCRQLPANRSLRNQRAPSAIAFMMIGPTHSGLATKVSMKRAAALVGIGRLCCSSACASSVFWRSR
jgi:hypothetical protein